MLIINPGCYKEFGSDLDGCSSQNNGGCKGCRCAIEVEDVEHKEPVFKVYMPLRYLIENGYDETKRQLIELLKAEGKQDRLEIFPL